MAGGRWRRLVCEGIAVTVSATIATAPLVAFHFERLPVATLVANLLAMPAVAPAMWAGMISVAVGQLSPSLAIPFNLGGSIFLAWIAQVAEWFGRPGWAVVEVSLGSPLVLAVVAMLTVLLSLLVIPAVFTGVDDVGQWFGRMLRRVRGRDAETSPTATPSPRTAP